MASVNKVILLGNLTRDPEFKDLTNGRLVRLGVATNRRYRDRETNEMKDVPQYHTVVVFNEQIVKFVEDYCTKGTEVYIEGSLEHRSYEDADGVKKNISEVVIRPYSGELQLGARSSAGGGGGRDNDDRDNRGRDDRGGRYDRGGRDDRDNRGGNRGGRDYDDDRGRDDRGRGNDRGNDRGRNNYDDMDDDIPF